jgi:hypothetical protein
MKADDVKRLKDLERENQTLKRIVADKELENVALRMRRPVNRLLEATPGSGSGKSCLLGVRLRIASP